MFRKILCLFTLLQFFYVGWSFESEFQEPTPKLPAYKTDGDFNEIDVEQIQSFFNTFRQVLAIGVQFLVMKFKIYFKSN